LVNPFDWQNSLAQRAQYIQARLAQGLPAAAISLPEGIVAAAVARSSRKVYEIYDRIGMTALGQQADIEALRVGAIDFCHREGYERSESDVTLSRLAMSVSQSLKRAFADYRASPIAVRALMVEIDDDPARDRFMTIDFDGEYTPWTGSGCIAGRDDVAEQLRARLAELKPASPEEAARALHALLEEALTGDQKRDLPGGEAPAGPREALKRETRLIRRGEGLERRFSLIPLD
jgi:proteasome alpha subunit